MAHEKDLSLANLLVAALPSSGRALLLAYCELVELKPRQVLAQAGQPLDYGYFPVDSFVSVVLSMDDAPPVQVAMIGNEGMLHTSLARRLAWSEFTCVAQGPGRAFRIQRSALQQRVAEDAALGAVLDRYADVCQTCLAREAVCLKHHSVRQRLARWLLMTRDRSHSGELFITHQSLAFMLDVRRESVSRAAGEFEKQGLVSYTHGYMVLIDEAGLKRASCGCYQANIRVYERVLQIPGTG